MKKPFKSLASHLSLWIISLGTIIFLTVLTVNYYYSRNLLESYITELAQRTSEATAHEVETAINSAATSADLLASTVAESNLSEQQIHQSIKSVLKANNNVYGMTVALKPETLLFETAKFAPYYFKKDNQLEYTDLTSAEYQYQTWPWYTRVEKSNRATLSEPYMDEGGGNIMMTTYSSPILSNLDFAGVATADISLNWLGQLVKKIRIGEQGFGFIVSSQDTIIAHPNPSNNLKKLSDVIDDRNVSAQWQQYIANDKLQSLHLKTTCKQFNENCWVAVEPLGEIGWKIIIVVPESEIIADIQTLTIKITLFALTGLITLVLVVSAITRHFTKPLSQLTQATKEIGSGNLENTLPEVREHNEIGLLSQDFERMRSDLVKYISQVKDATAKQQKLESEIHIARDIQMSMLPGNGNAYLHENNYQLYAFLRPARSVGGDLYYYQKTGDQLQFIIGDVSDKGVPAALFMAKTVTLYTRALRDRLSPGQTLSMMNDILSQNNDACMFVTALCGELNLGTGELIMANAGHMNPLVKEGEIKHNSSTAERDIPGATALGLMDGIEYPDVTTSLSRGDMMVLYTDGISEAHNTSSEQYGDDRLSAFISGMDKSNCELSGKAILQDVDRFANGTEQFDDITLFMIRYE